MVNGDACPRITTKGETAFAPHRLVDEKNKWIPFGGGRHACVGRYFAFLQIKTITSVLFRHYDIVWADPAWEPAVDYSQIVATPPPCHVKLTKRKATDILHPLF